MINILKKMDSNRFYVGELNFAFYFKNLLIPDTSNKENKYTYQDFMNTIYHGAVDLTKNSFDKINEDSKYFYKSVFTLFYKLDNGKYLCLHNGNIYGNLQKDYIENLSPLEDLLPKLDYVYPNKLSVLEALNLFKKSFQKKINGKTLFKIDRFYDGKIDLCTSKYHENDEYHHINLIDSLLLKKLFIGAGYTLVRDEEQYNYQIFNSIFYRFSNGDLYNINNNQLYKANNQKVLERVINIDPKVSLKDSLEEREIPFEEEVSISKVLKLQEKMYKK